MSKYNPDLDLTPVILKKKKQDKKFTKLDLLKEKEKGNIITVEKIKLTDTALGKIKLAENNDPERPAASSYNFKVALQKARANKKMTQVLLAQQLGLKSSLIADYENGKSIPEHSTIMKINKILGVTLPNPRT